MPEAEALVAHKDAVPHERWWDSKLGIAFVTFILTSLLGPAARWVVKTAHHSSVESYSLQTNALTAEINSTTDFWIGFNVLSGRFEDYWSRRQDPVSEKARREFVDGSDELRLRKHAEINGQTPNFCPAMPACDPGKMRKDLEDCSRAWRAMIEVMRSLAKTTDNQSRKDAVSAYKESKDKFNEAYEDLKGRLNTLIQESTDAKPWWL
jgi:hypothetical protein